MMAEGYKRCALQITWYAPLSPTFWTTNGFRLTLVGRTITRIMVGFLEFVGIAPKGSVRVSKFLEKGADGLVAGGKLDIFTPMFLVVGRKPDNLDARAPAAPGKVSAENTASRYAA